MAENDPRDSNPLEKALSWLQSHVKRLRIERDSLRSRLEVVTREVERVESEIEIAEKSLRRNSDE
jgi:predicted RNase H-like nuclease (RuvC/YqgF family)